MPDGLLNQICKFLISSSTRYKSYTDRNSRKYDPKSTFSIFASPVVGSYTKACTAQKQRNVKKIKHHISISSVLCFSRLPINNREV